MENVIIIGTGCAGWTAAIYAARADLSPLILTGEQPGGQLTTTTEVENYPGFPEGVMGPDLMTRMQEQAEKFGTRVEFGVAATAIRGSAAEGFTIEADGSEYRARAVIIATGARPRHLGLPNEKQLVGRGLTSCATCDGAFYRNVPVAVIGGGDSACEEATFLTKFASKVYLIHRRDELRASRIMAERALGHERIEPVWNAVVTEYLTNDDGEMRAVKLRSTESGKESELEVACVFVAIGHIPNTSFVQELIDLDPNGYILQQAGSSRTNVPGIFACGDVADHVYRQAVTAAGDGCRAALDAERFLAEHAPAEADLPEIVRATP